MSTTYRIRHLTRYKYHDPVSLCHNLAWLTPRSTPWQEPIRFHLEISPTPSVLQGRLDAFGNQGHYFEIMEPHRTLAVQALSLIVVRERAQAEAHDLSWEEAQAVFRGGCLPEEPANCQFLLDSPHIRISEELADYARPSFPEGRSLLHGVTDLMHRIHADFTYQSLSTTVSTPLHEVMARRTGVCQDFAHVAIGALRSLGLAARYVSGYLETLPPPGRPRLVGADASHAWFAVLLPGFGWIDFDPTNDLLPGQRHVTVAWGRDYSDLPPVKGVVMGGQGETLEVSVDVARVDVEEE
ncbi:MAG: transglutaminase family protein [Magnetococcales bacterium]|nr:transglutaminase family protein [Magnetococcales bacterium]